MKSKNQQSLLNKSKTFGKWAYITPVSGVILTKEIKNEFRINKVTLISKSKLKKTRKKYGFLESITNLEKKVGYKDFFSTSDIYAVTWFSGSIEDAKIACRKIIRDELSILALSQLGYGHRRLGPYPTLLGEGHVKKVQELLIETNNERVQLSYQVTGNLQNLALHGHWLNFQKEYFLKLLKILRGEIKVSREWRKDIERAAILIGQGLSFNNTTQSFLWNIIALESLFNENDDKFSKEFPKRAEAFLGWVGFWNAENYSRRITELYGKRSAFVHQGNKELISTEDLLFTDNLIFNLMRNIIKHIEMFPNKKAIIDFSKKVEAEHLLGLKSKVRPKTLSFMPKRYYEQDLKEM